jgi:hypothetical protein
VLQAKTTFKRLSGHIRPKRLYEALEGLEALNGLRRRPIKGLLRPSKAISGSPKPYDELKFHIKPLEA